MASQEWSRLQELADALPPDHDMEIYCAFPTGGPANYEVTISNGDGGAAIAGDDESLGKCIDEALASLAAWRREDGL